MLSVNNVVAISAIVCLCFADHRISRAVGQNNGTVAEAGDLPYFARITATNFGAICGGAIVSNRFVVTAASCVKNSSPVELAIYSGIFNQTEQLHEAKNLHVHHLFDPRERLHDLAVIELVEAIVFSAEIYPIPLQTVIFDGETDANATGATDFVSGNVIDTRSLGTHALQRHFFSI